MKKLGYLLFAFIYYICCIFPRNQYKVFCIMTHDPSDRGNVGVVVQALKERGGYTFHELGKEERDVVTKKGKVTNLVQFFLIQPYHLATASIVLQDNIFLPMAYMKFPKKVKVIQLWHGTGTIKRFGQSVNDGELGRLEKAADRTITHLIINGKATKEIYQEAFGVDEDKVYELGLPRTDLLFDKEACEDIKDDFYKRYPELKNKQLVLYAPTFRDSEVSSPKLPFDLETLMSSLPEDMTLGLRLHPFVAKSFQGIQLKDELKGKVYDFSCEPDTNQLLLISDLLITDYSSIIFEYCVLRKPMLFYAYDYDLFKKEQRGFYEDYETFVPGTIVYNQAELIKVLQQGEYDISKVDDFMKRQYRYTDGKSTQRLIDQILCK